MTQANMIRFPGPQRRADLQMIRTIQRQESETVHIDGSAEVQGLPAKGDRFDRRRRICMMPDLLPAG